MGFSDGARPSLRRVGKRWVSVAFGDGLLPAQMLILRFLVNYLTGVRDGTAIGNRCEDPITRWDTDGVLG